jgi:hypothetical protein
VVLFAFFVFLCPEPNRATLLPGGVKSASKKEHRCGTHNSAEGPTEPALN